MLDLAVRQPPEGSWVGGVLIGPELERNAWRHDPTDELLHGVASRLTLGTSETLLEIRALFPLTGLESATATQLRLVEPVDVVRGTDQQVRIEGPVLA